MTDWKMDDDTRPADRRTMSTDDLTKLKDTLAFWDDITEGAMADDDGRNWAKFQEFRDAVSTITSVIDTELVKRENPDV